MSTKALQYVGAAKVVDSIAKNMKWHHWTIVATTILLKIAAYVFGCAATAGTGCSAIAGVELVLMNAGMYDNFVQVIAASINLLDPGRGRVSKSRTGNG